LLRFSGGDEKSGVAGVAELDIAWRESLSCGVLPEVGAPVAVSRPGINGSLDLLIVILTPWWDATERESELISFR
jgi:hypothetical protein